MEPSRVATLTLSSMDANVLCCIRSNKELSSRGTDVGLIKEHHLLIPKRKAILRPLGDDVLVRTILGGEHRATKKTNSAAKSPTPNHTR
jgi:hypothetical protein